MRIGVYDRFWSSRGGGEYLALMAAKALEDDADVELIGPEDIDLDELGARFRTDISGLGTREVSALRGAAAAASADYDLFVACSYQHSEPCLAHRGLYLAQFPHELESSPGRIRHRAGRVVRPVLPGCELDVERGDGFWPTIPPRTDGRVRDWTMGDAELRVHVPRDVAVDVVFSLRRGRPRGAPPADLEVHVDGRREPTASLEWPLPGRSPNRVLRIPLPTSTTDRWVPIRMRSTTFVPSDFGSETDHRDLGIQIRGVRFLHRDAPHPLRTWDLVNEVLPADHRANFLAGYRVVAISEYVRRWVEKRWQVPATVVYPPVRPFEPGAKAPEILSVGRFFPNENGHSKQQLAMVEAFRRLVDDGLRDWSLHLAGSVLEKDQSYLDAVRDAAQDLPVHFHLDPPSDELAQCYARASLYWHAAGLGMDLAIEPADAEHFGIATVEAMSAGAVPLVFDAGGQTEIVTDGIDGVTFADVDRLCSATLELAADPAERERMAAAARTRSRHFAPSRFDEALRALAFE